MRILILDNYDSFVYNIIGLLQQIEAEGRFSGLIWDVCLNDAVDIEQVPYYDAVILSPGPGLPSEAGCMPEILRRYAHTIPILGICLGFQAIAERFGALLLRLPSPRHGHMSRLSGIDSDDPVTGVLADGDRRVGRYHSWIVDPSTMPKELVATSYDEEGNIMSLRHTTYRLFGTQFHPESIMTTDGRKLLEAFLAQAVK